MKLRTAFAVAVAAVSIGAPVAGATPDGYQPQLRSGSQPDALDRYLRNNAPDAGVEMTGAAGHPDSRAVRVGPTAETTPVAGEGRDWETGALGALGGVVLAFLAIAGASAIRERRQPALH